MALDISNEQTLVSAIGSKRPLLIGNFDPSELPLSEFAAFAIDHTWSGIFNNAKDELERIEKMLQKVQCRYSNAVLPSSSWLFYPQRKNLFRVFREVAADTIKMIILGMDPYPGVGADGTPLACGIAFASEHSIPASLNNVFGELQRSIPSFVKPKTGDLRPWCKEGVLLLNASLTHLPSDSHQTQKDVWLPLIYKVLGEITSNRKNLVICLWGRDAQSYQKYINGTHLVLKSSHPSPMSASKGEEPFTGCNHFALANAYLLAKGVKPVNWSLTPA